MKNSIKTVAVFESWINGGIQLSSIYYNQEATDFIEAHYNSGTFAELHEFESKSESIIAYNYLLDKNQ